MNSLLKADEERKRAREQPEINLSAASLLGLFAGLVLICGVFFGLGYSVGRRPARASAAAAVANGVEPAASSGLQSAASNPTKPSAATSAAQEPVNGSSLPAADMPAPVAGAQPAQSQSQSVDLPIDETPPPELQPSAARLAHRPAQAAASASSASPAAANMPSSAQKPAAGAAPSGTMTGASSGTTNGTMSGTMSGTMVQVAAVVHQEDANVLVSALRQKGYNAVVRSEPGDKLLHVQIGPYSDRAQALTMRQKLLSDGYNAILKQ